ncbi:dsRBD fold-containing protein [Kitasatospora sp. NPDC089509]|uniref:dsRBD fold-containing protein n=1 Tax=Kitasatospora sp. NPDC089509 TaxID=3364079 RepID=UPI0037FC998D
MIVRADGADGAATAGGERPPTAEPENGPAPGTVRTKDWRLSLHLAEEGDTTRVHAVLDADGEVLHSDALARRNPRDAPAAAVGDEFAVGRALVDLGHQLLRAGVHGATGPAEE